VIALWVHRGYIWETALSDLRHRYAGSGLGVFWNVLTPLAMLALYTFIFTRVLTPGTTGDPFAGDLFVLYLGSGFLPWGAFADCVARGTNALVGNAIFLKKMPIPEQVFVAQAAVSAALAMLIVEALLVLLALFRGQPPHWSWLLLPVVGVLWQVFGFGLGLFLGTLNVFFRDIAQVLTVLFQIWMWSLPVIYLEEVLPAAYRDLLPLNPAYPFLRSLRDVYLGTQLPELWLWLAMLAWAAAACAVGLSVVAQLRSEIRDVL
jgi:lipopolysaccharide transport system permease protein